MRGRSDIVKSSSAAMPALDSIRGLSVGFNVFLARLPQLRRSWPRQTDNDGVRKFNCPTAPWALFANAFPDCALIGARFLARCRGHAVNQQLLTTADEMHLGRRFGDAVRDRKRDRLSRCERGHETEW
jgi:hypothetical protein